MGLAGVVGGGCGGIASGVMMVEVSFCLGCIAFQLARITFRLRATNIVVSCFSMVSAACVRLLPFAFGTA